MLIKKEISISSNRLDPTKNKSLAIRTVLKKMQNAKALEVAAVVKKEYGHDVSQNMIYMVKTKTNMASDRRGKKSAGPAGNPMTSAAAWVDAIKLARQLLQASGSVANAIALLKAVDG